MLTQIGDDSDSITAVAFAYKSNAWIQTCVLKNSYSTWKYFYLWSTADMIEIPTASLWFAFTARSQKLSPGRLRQRSTTENNSIIPV